MPRLPPSAPVLGARLISRLELIFPSRADSSVVLWRSASTTPVISFVAVDSPEVFGVSEAMTRWVPVAGSARDVALEVLLHGPLSRSELARRLGLSPGSVSRLTKPLLDAGMLVEAGVKREARIGRPSLPLDVVESSRHFVG